MAEGVPAPVVMAARVMKKIIPVLHAEVIPALAVPAAAADIPAVTRIDAYYRRQGFLSPVLLTRRITMMTRGLSGESPANVSFHLKGMDFPAGKQELMQQAKENGAPSEVLGVIERMPDNDFQNMADVMKAYGDAGTDSNAQRRAAH